MSTLPMVGSELAGYRLHGILGRGGMSVVYEAESPRLGVTVAVKVLNAELTGNDAFRTRFLKESRIAASLNHPNVIPIYDVGSHEDLLYIAMRYVSGADLRAVLRARRVIAPDQALLLLGQAGRALDAAHRRGLVHRDVKPGNVLIEPSEEEGEPDHVYLTDFGISKHVASRSGLTATGEFMGTIDYIAPEQIKAQPVDGHADIYSLGCVLYECLTGRVPFSKDVDAAVIWAHVEEVPATPSAVRAGLPRAIDEVMGKALAKDPAARYATCREFITAARAALIVPTAAPARPGTVVTAIRRPEVPAPSGPGSTPRPTPAGAAASRPSFFAPPHEEPPGGSPPSDPPYEEPPGGSPPSDPPATPQARPRRQRLLAGLGALVLVIAAIGGWLIWHANQSSSSGSAGPSMTSPPIQVVGWRLGHGSPFAVQYAAVAKLNGHLWVAGGLLGPKFATNKTEYYDPTLDTWSPGPPLPAELHHANMVAYQGTLWLIGGFAAHGRNVLADTSARVLKLDLAHNRWVDGPPLHHARAAAAAAVVGNKIVVVGGRTGSSQQLVKPTEIFDGTSWHDAAPILVPGNHLAAASDGRYLYVVGGHGISETSPTAALQRFDPATDKWATLPSMPSPASGLGAAVVGGQLITVGGDNGLTVFSTVRAYNLATRAWSTLPSLREARSGMAVVAYRHILYALDGAAQPGHIASTNTVQILSFHR